MITYMQSSLIHQALLGLIKKLQQIIWKPQYQITTPFYVTCNSNTTRKVVGHPYILLYSFTSTYIRDHWDLAASNCFLYLNLERFFYIWRVKQSWKKLKKLSISTTTPSVISYTIYYRWLYKMCIPIQTFM